MIVDADRHHRTQALRHLVVWMLALVVPLQGMAVGVMTVRGPNHAHLLIREDALLAADFRRNLGRHVEVDPVRRFFADAAHGHAHAETQFHYHAVGDASVRYADDDGFGGALGDDGTTAGDASGAFLPLPAHAATWADPGASSAPDAGPFWTPTAALAARLDRPPGRSAV